MKEYYVIGNEKGTYTGEEPIYVPFSFVRFIQRTRHYEHISDEINHGTLCSYSAFLVERFEDEPYGLRVLGKIVNVLADESVLDEKGRVDPAKLRAFAFDQMQNGYYAATEKIGKAWNAGKGFVSVE